jgi:uncharacterized membrane protein
VRTAVKLFFICSANRGFVLHVYVSVIRDNAMISEPIIHGKFYNAEYLLGVLFDMLRVRSSLEIVEALSVLRGQS